MRVGLECGQRWYSIFGWRFRPFFRKFPGGISAGPIMIVRGDW